MLLSFKDSRYLLVQTEATIFVILAKWKPSNIDVQTVIYYKSVQELNGNTFVPSSTLLSENEARVACYEMGMSLEEGSGSY